MSDLNLTDLRDAISYTRTIDRLRREAAERSTKIFNFKFPSTAEDYEERARLSDIMAGTARSLARVYDQIAGRPFEYDLQPTAKDEAEVQVSLACWYEEQASVDLNIAYRLRAVGR